jgi:hypothetical protein
MKPDQHPDRVLKLTVRWMLILPILFHPGLDFSNIQLEKISNFLTKEVKDKGRSEDQQVGGGSHFNPPQLHPRGRPTGTQRPGGSKGDCPVVEPPLTALIPQADQVWGLTTQEYPTYWFYLPYTADQIHSVQFSLWKVATNGNREEIYSNNLNLSHLPGIVSINPTVPEAAIALSNETEENIYEWILTVNCDDPGIPGGSNKRRVEGSIARYNLPELDSASLDFSSLETAQFLANKGIWYDALMIIGDLRLQSDSDELKNAWQQLLESDPVKLEDISNKPIKNCCDLQQSQ